jgi:hypothetical protein
VTTSERAERNAAIVADRARGLSWSLIAQNHDVTDRHARRVAAEQRDTAAPSLLQRDAIAIVEEVLHDFDTAIHELAVLAAETDHDSSRLGAIKARLDVQRSRIELLQMVGALPRELAQVGVIIDLRQIAA